VSVVAAFLEIQRNSADASFVAMTAEKNENAKTR
jgi:hypothetical protein